MVELYRTFLLFIIELELETFIKIFPTYSILIIFRKKQKTLNKTWY